jgi:hypothetical protein
MVLSPSSPIARSDVVNFQRYGCTVRRLQYCLRAVALLRFYLFRFAARRAARRAVKPTTVDLEVVPEIRCGFCGFVDRHCVSSPLRFAISSSISAALNRYRGRLAPRPILINFRSPSRAKARTCSSVILSRAAASFGSKSFSLMMHRPRCLRTKSHNLRQKNSTRFGGQSLPRLPRSF